MRSTPTLRTLGLSLLILLGFAKTDSAATLPAKDRMVIVISLDGFPAYLLEDPKLPIPTLRSLMTNGSYAKTMQPVNPSVTWPNHTTMVTGLFPMDHGLLYNGMLVRTESPLSAKVDWQAPKVKMVHVPTLYDIAFKGGLTTAQVDWVAINDAPTVTWAFPEKAKESDPLVKEMIAKNVISAEDVSDNGKPTILWRDQIWTKAGVYLIQQHKPNLLLFHLLTLDATHHSYSPRNLAGYDAIAFLDSCVKQLVDAVKDAGMSQKTTFVVVSDHGFKAVKKMILTKPLVKEAGVADAAVGVPEGGSAMFYVAKNNREETIAKLTKVLQGTEGVSRVAQTSELNALGLPTPEQDPQGPDLVAFAKTDYSFGGGKDDAGSVIQTVQHPVGSHGYLYSDPEMGAIFIASGYGIKQGVVLDDIKNRSVAPTLAELLGLKLPKTIEPPLTQILSAQ